MHSLFPNAQNGVPYEHLVFVNDGTGHFEDFSDESGLRDVQAGFFAFGDVDDDGDQDVFAGLDLVDYAPNTSAMYLNDGEGHFTHVEGSAVEGTPNTTQANAVFADFNGDGELDLFVGNGGTTYSDTDLLFANMGGGELSNQSAALQGQIAQPSNGSVTCDYDDDGDLDIFVSTYSVSTMRGHNHLWENDGNGVMTNVATERGFAAQATGNYWLLATGYGLNHQADATEDTWIGSNGFGIDCGDVDNDGDLDVLLTAISHPVASDFNRAWSDPSQVLANLGPDEGYRFENQWLARGLPFNEGDVDGAFVDFDHDGRLDISLSRERKYEGSYEEPDQKSWFGLMHQLPTGAYESVGVDSGINDPDEGLLRMKGAQNHAWSDIDHDGDLDLLVGGRDQGGGRPNFLFRNDVGQDQGWLAVRVEGDGEAVTRDAIGTRITLRSGNDLRMREKKSSRGMYNSEDTRALHMGLGGMSCEGRTLEVRWPDGTVVTFDETEFTYGTYMTVRYPDELVLEE